MIVIPKRQLERPDANSEMMADEPRPIGELMNAVLARYGISAKTEIAPPRLPALDDQTVLFDTLIATR
jgi:hypothetical protein